MMDMFVGLLLSQHRTQTSSQKISKNHPNIIQLVPLFHSMHDMITPQASSGAGVCPPLFNKTCEFLG